MFRGYRWQLVIFIIALAVCAAAALFRASRGPQPNPTPQPTPALQATTSAAIGATAIPAANEPERAQPHVYNEGLVGQPQRLNPLFAHLNTPDQDITALIFEGLFAFNDYGEPVPRLAAELIISSDGLDYVGRLRDDILWQDGTPFSADDVIFTAALMSDRRYAEISPTGAFWASVETQRLDTHLLRFRLAQPYSDFPTMLTFGILPEHALRGSDIDQLAQHPFNLRPIGTGPYQLAAIESSDGQAVSSLKLALSPTFRQRPEARSGYLLRELHFHFYADKAAALRAFQAEEIDALAGLAPGEIDALTNSQVYRQVESTLGILIFNWQTQPFAERRARQAMSLSLDAPALIQAHFGSSATFADSPLVPGSAAYLPQPFWTNHDLERAQNLIGEEDAAAADDADETPAAALRLLVEDRVPLPALAHDIADAWRMLDLDFVIEPLAAADLRERLQAGQFDAAIVKQQIGASADLFRFWHPAQTDAGNFGAAADNEIAELLELARLEIYGTRRAQHVQRFQEAFAEQALAIPLFYPVYAFLAHERMEGIRLGYLNSAADRYRGFQHWRPATSAS